MKTCRSGSTLGWVVAWLVACGGEGLPADQAPSPNSPQTGPMDPEGSDFDEGCFQLRCSSEIRHCEGPCAALFECLAACGDASCEESCREGVSITSLEQVTALTLCYGRECIAGTPIVPGYPIAEPDQKCALEYTVQRTLPAEEPERAVVVGRCIAPFGQSPSPQTFLEDAEGRSQPGHLLAPTIEGARLEVEGLTPGRYGEGGTRGRAALAYGRASTTQSSKYAGRQPEVEIAVQVGGWVFGSFAGTTCANAFGGPPRSCHRIEGRFTSQVVRR